MYGFYANEIADGLCYDFYTTDSYEYKIILIYFARIMKKYFPRLKFDYN